MAKLCTTKASAYSMNSGTSFRLVTNIGNSRWISHGSLRMIQRASQILKRTRSLDSGTFAKAVAVELAFRNELCLV
jgi:hypothetical protein